MNLVLENIGAGYDGKIVVSGVDLSLPPGRICALMGRNGSGKTTLLRCINAVIKPMHGSVLLDGRNIEELSRPQIAQMISVVPQGASSPFSFSCLDMVMMSAVSRLKSWQLPAKKERSKAIGMMEDIGITHLASKAFNAISGGERQMVMLARALFQDTPVMLLDEPNSHLDFINQHRVMTLMKDLAKKRKITVIVSLHDPNLTHYYCDDVVMIHQGRVAAKGETKTVMTQAVLSEVLGGDIACEVTRNGVFVVTPSKG